MTVYHSLFHFIIKGIDVHKKKTKIKPYDKIFWNLFNSPYSTRFTANITSAV